MSERFWHLSIRRLGAAKGDATEVQIKHHDPHLHAIVDLYSQGKPMRGKIVDIELRPGNPNAFIVHVDEVESDQVQSAAEPALVRPEERARFLG